MSESIRIIRRSQIDELAEIIQHANSPTCPRGMLEINPAFGCQFRCAYCGIYAAEKEYYGDLIIYENYPEYLDNWLVENNGKVDSHYFYFSAKTDCLQPALIECGLTSQILEVLRKRNARYFVVTKGGLPPADICELLIEAKDINQVIISATMPGERLRSLLEPDAATIEERLAFVEFCVANGIFITASCSPILPVGDRQGLLDNFARFARAGVKHFYFDFARLSRQAVDNMIELLPEFREEFGRHYLSPDAQESIWNMTHRNRTIEKYQPPLRYMLDAFEELADCVREAVPDATVSVCNHFATAQTLPKFNEAARAECISCIGHRFGNGRA